MRSPKQNTKSKKTTRNSFHQRTKLVRKHKKKENSKNKISEKNKPKTQDFRDFSMNGRVFWFTLL